MGGLMKRFLLFAAFLCAACSDLHNAGDAAKAGDYGSAVSQWQYLASHDFPEAQTRLARCYIKGQGVPQSPEKAAPLLQRAAAQGYAPAFQDLGQLYEKGVVFPKDPAKAEELYKKSAELGNAHAWLVLGRFYRRQKDEAKAQSAFALAAKSGYPLSTTVPYPSASK
jgi:TPR repeat protein